VEIKEEDSEEKPRFQQLLVVVDEASLDYLEKYSRSRDNDPAVEQARHDSARQRLAAVLEDLANPSSITHLDKDGDTAMADTEEAQAEIVTIPLTADDELADIPAEMRETVATEITAFRERSNRRDMERLRMQEELEASERARHGGGRHNRLSSPVSGAPSGPGGTNGIPLGPRGSGVQGAPSGPKGFQGMQIPRDYQKGVTFVNGSGVNGAAGGWIDREDEDSDASDEELERRRTEKQNAVTEKQYLDHERRWLNREKARTSALDREQEKDTADQAREAKEAESMARRLGEWDDALEATKKTEEYYADKGAWVRQRAVFRAREIQWDDRDRQAEARETEKEAKKQEQARGFADQFLAKQAEEIEKTERTPTSTRGPQQPFKLSLGAAAQKAQAAAGSRRTVAEVEGLLEDEEEASTTTKRTLIPIKYDASASLGLSDEERELAVKSLAAEIPSDKEGLWAWPVKWEFVDESVLEEKLKPFVERKIVEYLGVQEQLLVDVIEEHIRARKEPGGLVEMLEEALDEEAEALVKKLWRMIIFFSESEKRGLSA
jgi:PWI domain